LSGFEVMKPVALVLIDGECVMCHRVARFVIRHDRAGGIRFAALGSTAAARALEKDALPPPPAGTFVLILDGRAYYRSEAAARLCGLLPLPWRLGRYLLVVPRPLRDAAYAIVASVRYRLFGKTSACAMLRPNERERFLTDESPSETRES